MTISIFKFDLSSYEVKMTSRENGQFLLNEILTKLESYEKVEIDFGFRSPTPSFADQCIGGLVKSRGYGFFRKNVKLLNVSDDARPLLKHIIFTRAPQFIEKSSA